MDHTHDDHPQHHDVPLAGPVSDVAPHGDHPASPQVDGAHGGHAGHGGQQHAGHDRHEGHSVAMFRDRFWLSLLLTIPVVIWSPDVQEWLGYQAPTFPGSDLIPAVLGTAVFLYGGLVFLRGGLAEIRDRQPGMMLLISLAITRRLRDLAGGDARLVRGRGVVGAGHPHHHHAARPLAGDALHRPGARRARRARRPAARTPPSG